MRRGTSWILVVTVLAVLAAGLMILTLGPGERREIASAPPPPVSAPAAPARTELAPAPQKIAPSFDAVHIGPDGKAVIAGRAAPGADVTILDRGAAIGHVTADRNGEFVFMPEQPLPAGPQELGLSSLAPGETAPTPSTKSLAVLVPEHRPGAAPEAPVAVLLPQGKDETARAVQLGARTGHRVTLDMVEYDASGRIVFSGRADAGTRIELSIEDHRIGAATADASDAWSAEVQGGVPVGRYRLRLEAQVPGDGGVALLSVELRRASPGEVGSGSYLAVVPGNTLWHLAFRSFGEGLRYVEIYRANRDRIENPDRIYPGELLALPVKQPVKP
jgi:nucleoid-associated protein YgaU